MTFDHHPSPDDKAFLDFLFEKLTGLTDTDMIDLHDDDTTCDHIEFEKLTDKPECTCDPTCGSGCEGCCEEEDDS